MGNIDNMMFEIYTGIYGFIFFTYGLLISLDKIRIEKYTRIRNIVLVCIISSGIVIAIESAIEDGEYGLFIYNLVLIMGIIIFSYQFKRCRYNVFNLNKEEISSCIQRALDNINVKYKVNNDRIEMENRGYIQIEKSMEMASFQIKEVDDEKFLAHVIDNIKEEIYKYKLPKKILYKGGYVYMAIGSFFMGILVYCTL